MRRSHKRDWVKRLAPEHEYYEYNLERLTGHAATLTCDGAENELVVTMPKIRGHQVELIADELATLWPGFLAPAGVSLRINENQFGDGEAMALRYHANRER